MTSERGLVVSVRQDWGRPGWWLGVLTCLFSLQTAFAQGQVTADEARPLERLVLVVPADSRGGWI